MNAKTLRAIKASINHWERLATGFHGRYEGFGGEDCALCQIFRSEHTAAGMECIGCPVMGRTGYTFCDNSPYNNVCVAYQRHGKNMDAFAFRKAAIKQLYFLQSLLPEKAS